MSSYIVNGYSNCKDLYNSFRDAYKKPGVATTLALYDTSTRICNETKNLATKVSESSPYQHTKKIVGVVFPFLGFRNSLLVQLNQMITTFDLFSSIEGIARAYSKDDKTEMNKELWKIGVVAAKVVAAFCGNRIGMIVNLAHELSLNLERHKNAPFDPFLVVQTINLGLLLLMSAGLVKVTLARAAVQVAISAIQAYREHAKEEKSVELTGKLAMTAVRSYILLS